MNKAIAQLSFTILMFIFFIYTAIEATSFKKLAKNFPLFISILAITILLIEIVRQVVKLKENMQNGEVLHPNMAGVIKYTLILTLYIVMVYIIGIILASTIFVFLFLYFIANMKLIQSFITVAVLIGLLIAFGNAMNLTWPKSIFHILTIM